MSLIRSQSQQSIIAEQVLLSKVGIWNNYNFQAHKLFIVADRDDKGFINEVIFDQISTFHKRHRFTL